MKIRGASTTLAPNTANTDKKEEIMVKLRIHSYTEDLNTAWTKKTLGISDGDPAIRRVFEYEDDGVTGCDFREGDSLVSPEEARRWQRPVFRVATNWLRTRSTEQFRLLREAGGLADLLVGGYDGYIPLDLLRELVRLELELLVIKDAHANNA